MKPESLVFMGQPLFQSCSLKDKLIIAVRRGVETGFTSMPREDRAFSKLRLRRHLARMRVGQKVAITPGETVEILGEAEDGRLRAEHRSPMTGNADLLTFFPGAHPPELPVLGRVEGDQLLRS